uniref:Uncharacterized protein n=1 Tax=Phlegmariurus squarrosus TaxID=73615 RepID=H9M891_PHLSQ|nr:hypothetical protein HusqMp119 [Phlegmariurus squarrosus]AEV55798.1 hypothetical protein HusqMp119 [Phlegmariurus squarrosus]
MEKRFYPLPGRNPSPFRSTLSKLLSRTRLPFIRSPKVISLAQSRRAQSRHLNYEKKNQGSTRMARGSILTEWNDCGPAEDSSSSLPGLLLLTPWASYYMARVICCASRRRYPFTASVARRKGGQPNVSRPGQPCCP